MANKVMMDFWKKQNVEILTFNVKDEDYRGQETDTFTEFKVPCQLLRLTGLSALLDGGTHGEQTLVARGVHSGTIAAFLNWLYYGELFPQPVEKFIPADSAEDKSNNAPGKETISFVVTLQIACAISVVYLGNHIKNHDLQNDAIQYIWEWGKLPCDVDRLSDVLRDGRIPHTHPLHSLFKSIEIFQACKACLEKLPIENPENFFDRLNTALDDQLDYPDGAYHFLLI